MGYYARQTEHRHASIQRNALRSSIPVAKVMDILFENMNTPEALNPGDLIRTLADSFRFMGVANVELVQARKDNIKRELPKNLQGLCSHTDDSEYSPVTLFGEDLNSQIKKVSELNKIRSKFGESPFGGRRGARRGRGNFKFGRRARRRFNGPTRNRNNTGSKNGKSSAPSSRA